MAQRQLIINPQKCTGCRMCEVACSFQKERASVPSKARIHVLKWEKQGLDIPITCFQCTTALCMEACPVSALSRDKEYGSVVVSEEKCIGCKLCVLACPFGGIGFDMDKGKAIKCDLCNGDPRCAKICPTGAIKYTDVTSAIMEKNKLIATSLGNVEESNQE